MITKRHFLSGTIATGLSVAAPAIARAQAYPNRAIKVVLPYTPGSPNDVVDSPSWSITGPAAVPRSG